MNAVTHLEKVITGEVSAVTHLEKVITGETSAVTYTEKVITGEAPPITHLQKVIAGVENPVTHLEHVWAGSTPEPTEHEYTGAVPYTFTANGEPLLDWRISGNTVQSTTPTPQNPVMPQECGERTGNLIDLADSVEGYILADGTVSSSHANLRLTNYIAIPDGAVYITQSYGNRPTAMNLPALCFFDSGKNYISGKAFGNEYTKTFSVPTNAKYMRTCFRTTMAWVMLNTGSIALPYEPYGVKIPISSANTTTPVYLGEVETTRKIKKLVFDGTESDWGYVGEDITRYFRLSIGNLNEHIANTGYCTHFIQTAISSSTTNMGFTIINSSSQNKDFVAIRPDNAANTSLADFKTYLAQQYANGTPVTVWYVLATPETAVVNEPLMKIGDYADEVSNVATIPTNNGSTTIDVDTTVKPSEIYIKYKGV